MTKILTSSCRLIITLSCTLLMMNTYAKTTLLGTVKFDSTFISAYKEVDPDSNEKECFIILGNKRMKLLIYPDSIRVQGTPLYVIYLDDLTVDTAYLMVDQNKILRINGLLFTENKSYTLHSQLMAGNILSMRTFDTDASSIDVTVPLKGYTRLTRKAEAACRKNRR